MKSYRYALSILIFLLITSSASAAIFVEVPPPDSFRGLAWKTPLQKAGNLSPVVGKGYENTFFRSDENLKLGDAEIKSVAYYFHNGLFYRVGILFEGQVNHYHITKALLKEYGRAKRYGAKLGWIWPTFSIQLDFDYATKRGALYYTYEGNLSE